jgi:hypothetical protein
MGQLDETLRMTDGRTRDKSIGQRLPFFHAPIEGNRAIIRPRSAVRDVRYQADGGGCRIQSIGLGRRLSMHGRSLRPATNRIQAMLGRFAWVCVSCADRPTLKGTVLARSMHDLGAE